MKGQKIFIVLSLAMLFFLVGCKPAKTQIEEKIDSVQKNFDIQQFLYGDAINFPSNLIYEEISSLDSINTKKEINVLFIHKNSLNQNEITKVEELFLENWFIVFYDISEELHIELVEGIEFYAKRVFFCYKVVIMDFSYKAVAMGDDITYPDGFLRDLIDMIGLRK